MGMDPAIVDRAMCLYRAGTGEAAVPHAFIVWFDTLGWQMDAPATGDLMERQPPAQLVAHWVVWERTFG